MIVGYWFPCFPRSNHPRFREPNKLLTDYKRWALSKLVILWCMIVWYLNGLYVSSLLFCFNEFSASTKKLIKKDSGVFKFAQERKFNTEFSYSIAKSCVLSFILRFLPIFTLNSAIPLSDYLSIWHPHYWIIPLSSFAQNFTHHKMMINFPIHNIWADCKIWARVDSTFFTFSFFSSPNQIKKS